MVTRDTNWPEGTPCWVDLGVGDIPKATAFYSSVLGWDAQPGPPEAGGYAVALSGGRAAAGIGPKMGPAEAPVMWLAYLASDDADATARKITQAGGTVAAAPMDVMDIGRMAVAVDPAGAVFGIWQGAKHIGAGVANEPGALTWTEHFSRDTGSFEKAKAFYAAVFGYAYDDHSAEGFTYATLKLDGREVGGIGVYPPGTPESTPAAWGTYFGTADTDAAVAAVVKAGGKVLHEPSDSPYGRMAIVADNQGAVFNLISVRA